MAEKSDKRGYTPKGGRLPAKTLADAKTVARALSELAGPSSKQMITSQAGASIGGAFNAKFASANYYGLIKRESNDYVLTPTGEGVLADDGAAKCAAVMGTGFGPVIEKFSARPVNEDAIRQRLENDCGAAANAAKNFASVLIESSKDAGLIKNEKFDPAAIESVPKDVVGAKAQTSKRQSKQGGSNGGSASNQQEPPPPPPPPPDPPPPPTQAPPIQINIQIDASKMDAAQVAELIRALQEQK